MKAAVAQKNDASVRSTEEERSRADALYRELQLVCLGVNRYYTEMISVIIAVGIFVIALTKRGFQ